jgi:predicted nucleotidyltransferase
MIDLVKKNLAEICRLCGNYGVKQLDLFGSAARQDFDATRSDIDFLIEFVSYADPDIADRWFGFQEELAKLLGREVDLTSIRTATNPYFLMVANRSRVNLYAA